MYSYDVLVKFRSTSVASAFSATNVSTIVAVHFARDTTTAAGLSCVRARVRACVRRLLSLYLSNHVVPHVSLLRKGPSALLRYDLTFDIGNVRRCGLVARYGVRIGERRNMRKLLTPAEFLR